MKMKLQLASRFIKTHMLHITQDEENGDKREWTDSRYQWVGGGRVHK